MISLVLATLNRYNELVVFLDSVINSKILFQIIVVDQNDAIKLEPIISKYHNLGLNIVHIKTSERNLSNARNIGIADALYDIIGFPDDDCFYESETLSNIVKAFEISNADIIIGKWVENNYEYADFIKDISGKQIMSFNSCPLSSITIFAKKNVLNILNGFDKRLGVGQWYGSGEETDLIMRANIQHYKIVFTPKVIVHHKYNNMSNIFLQTYQQIISRARGTGAIYSKNNLPMLVILRGLFSPLFKCIFCFSLKTIRMNQCMFYGRLTGFIKWSNSVKRV